MTKTLTIALTAVSLVLLGALAGNTADAQTRTVSFRTATTYVCSVASARREYRHVKNDLERAADDTDFFGERIARNAFREADEILRTPVTATCAARAGRYTDATRVLSYALRRLELRKPKTEPQQFRANVFALVRVR